MKIKVVNKQLKKINEAESTMPPMGAQSTMPPNLKSPQKQQKRVPKPPQKQYKMMKLFLIDLIYQWRTALYLIEPDKQS